MTISNHSFVTDSPEATLTLGNTLGQAISKPVTIGLVGPLGAGKTMLIRGLAEGLDVPPSQPISSPTFVLIQEYFGRMPLYHFDTYRLRDATQFDQLGIDEYFDSDGVVAVEWSDRFPQCLPSHRVDIHIEIVDFTHRRFSMQGMGPDCAELIARLGETV